MESPRETFRVAMETVLLGISGERFWGGSYPDALTRGNDITPFALQNSHPYFAVVELPDSALSIEDTDGAEADEYQLGLYGQTARHAAEPDTSARLWANRLLHDFKITLRRASLPGGIFWAIPGLDFLGMTFGREDFGFNDTNADFLLPCTARLSYVLAPMH